MVHLVKIFHLHGQQAGADEGSGTRSSLMYETIRIVKKLKPKYVIWENVKNLISKKHKHNFDKYLQALSEGGYTNYWQVLNAKDYGIPQNRERVFTISIRNDIKKDFTFPEKQELKLRLKDMLEDNVDEKYYLSEQQYIYVCGNAINGNLKDIYDRKKALFNKNISYTINTKQDRRIGDTNYIAEGIEETTCEDVIKIRNNTKQGYLEAEEGDGINISSRMKWQRGNVQKQMCQTIDTYGNDRGVVVGAYARDFGSKGKVQDKKYCDTLTASMGEGGGNMPLYNDLRIRKLTPKECWRLMGFSDEAFEKAQKVNSNTQLYKQAGNSIVVNVLEAIFKELLGG